VGFPLAGAGVALGAEKPSVVVLGVHGSGAQSRETLSLIGDELVAGFMTSSLVPLHGAALASRIAQVREVLPERVFLSPVREAVARGKKLYQRANPEEAVAVLQAVVPLLESHRDFLRSPQLAVELYLHLGLAQLNLGQRSQAERSFEQVARIDPNRVLDDLNYSPKLVDAFEKVRSAVVGDRSASIVVALDGDDPGARVYVDARLVGTTPVTATRLSAGQHLVVVDAGELGMSSSEVTLEADQQLELPIKLAPGSLAIEGEAFRSPGDPVVRALYRQIGLASGADLVAVASFDSEGDFHLALYSARSDSYSADISASLAAAPGPRAAFVRQLVGRVARTTDENGNIRPEKMAMHGPAIRLRDNPTLDGLLWPRPPENPNTDGDANDQSLAKKTPQPPNMKALGILGAIVGGSLAAVGISFGVDAALREAGERIPVGILVVTVP
jgi:tetratricopeptide (TPR) repeat protein